MPEPVYSQLNHVLASLDIHVRNQAIDERFGAASSRLMRQVLEEAAGQVVEGAALDQALFEHFPGGVYLQDGTVVSLPHELSSQWRGSGGPAGTNASGLRIQVRWEMCGGLHGLWMQDARSSDRHGPALEEPYPADSLRIVDTAYLSYADMRAASQSGRFWITGVKANMLFRDGQGRWWNLSDWVASQPTEAQEVDVCKQEGQLDTWRSGKPWRILTEVYGKLLGVLLEHWVAIEGCWADPRRSLFKARQVVQWTVSWLVLAIRGEVSWEVVFRRMGATMGSNCWTDRRRHPPSTFQQLEDPKLCYS